VFRSHGHLQNKIEEAEMNIP